MGLLDDLQRLQFGRPLAEGLGQTLDAILQHRVGKKLEPELEAFREQFSPETGEAIDPKMMFDALNQLQLQASEFGHRGMRELAPLRGLSEEIIAREQATTGLELAQQQIRGVSAENLILEETGMDQARANIDRLIAQTDYIRDWDERTRVEGEIREGHIKLQGEMNRALQRHNQLFQERMAEREVPLQMHNMLQANPETQKLLQFVDENLAQRYFKPGNVDLRGLARVITTEQLGEFTDEEAFQTQYNRNLSKLFEGVSPAIPEMGTEMRMELWDLFVKERTKYDQGQIVGEPPPWMSDFNMFVAHFMGQDVLADPHGARPYFRDIDQEEKPSWFRRKEPVRQPTREDHPVIQELGAARARDRAARFIPDFPGAPRTLAGDIVGSPEAIEREQARRTERFEELERKFREKGLTLEERMEYYRLQELVGEGTR